MLHTKQQQKILNQEIGGAQKDSCNAHLLHALREGKNSKGMHISTWLKSLLNQDYAGQEIALSGSNNKLLIISW